MDQVEILYNMIEGSLLTINPKDGKAHLDKYTTEEVELHYSQAYRCTFFDIVDCEGGNLDTGDKHFRYKPTTK